MGARSVATTDRAIRRLPIGTTAVLGRRWGNSTTAVGTNSRSNEKRFGDRSVRNPRTSGRAAARLRYPPSAGPQEALTVSPAVIAAPQPEPEHDPKNEVRGEGPLVELPELPMGAPCELRT